MQRQQERKGSRDLRRIWGRISLKTESYPMRGSFGREGSANGANLGKWKSSAGTGNGKHQVCARNYRQNGA